MSAAVLLTSIAKCGRCSKAHCRIQTNVGVASLLGLGERPPNGSTDCFRSEFRTAGSWYDTCCPQASSEVPESRMHRFVSMKQSCDCARVHVRAPAPGRRPISDHSGPHDLSTVRTVAEVREHLLGRVETRGHWRLRWRAILARGSDLRQRRSRAAHRARLHRNRTKRAEAIRFIVDPGCGDPNMNREAPPPLCRPRWRNRTRLDVTHAQGGEMLADSATAAAFAVRDSRACAPRQAESQPGADLGPNRPPHRPPRRVASCSHITELSTRQLRCARALRPSIRVRGLFDRSLLRGAYPFRTSSAGA